MFGRISKNFQLLRCFGTKKHQHIAPHNVGILGAEIYFPKTYVAQEDLEKHDKVGTGKYTKGLGQSGLAFVSDREDIYSVCLSAVSSLMRKYGLSYRDIGRLEVGTETILDHSKSVKSVLMQLFEKEGNSDVEGIDTMNACYGGTNALFNSCAWVESSAWDGRYAISVTADIAEYAVGPARPTGGCGAIAMLIGPNAPIYMHPGLRSTHMEHAYDFYKPNFDSPYPIVDGKFSNICYLRSLDRCFDGLVHKHMKARGSAFDFNHSDYILFHAPYNKLVQKSIARLLFNDFLRHPDREDFQSVSQYKNINREKSYEDSKLEKAFVELSQPLYASKTGPTTLLPQQLGNMYTASLYAGLLSLVHTQGDHLAGKELMMFSYGSGLASTLFLMGVDNTKHAKEQLNKMKHDLDLEHRLAQRRRATPEEFNKMMQLREDLHKVNTGFEPSTPVTEKDFFPNTYYLTKKDDKGRRFYDHTLN